MAVAVQAARARGAQRVAVPFCALAVLEELSGSRTGVEDPYFPPDRELAYDALQDHQRRAIEAATTSLPAVLEP